MLIRNFRIAAKGKGKYCPVKNELQIRKGRKTYRFTCEERELWFSSPDHADVPVLIAPDASVRELRRSITSIVDSYDFQQGDPPSSY